MYRMNSFGVLLSLQNFGIGAAASLVSKPVSFSQDCF